MRHGELAPAAGLTAITGETGAGKTILAQAIGLLLGAKGDAGAVGASGGEAYVEAELDLPEGFFEDEELAGLAELAPEGEPGMVVARRVFADGRTRAYAWGRAVAREDLAAAAERLIAMSGQFEQRRLGRSSYQLDVLDAYCGEEQLRRRRESRVAWRELTAARKRHEELTLGAAVEATRLRELAALVEVVALIERADLVDLTGAQVHPAAGQERVALQGERQVVEVDGEVLQRRGLREPERRLEVDREVLVAVEIPDAKRGDVLSRPSLGIRDALGEGEPEAVTDVLGRVEIRHALDGGHRGASVARIDRSAQVAEGRFDWVRGRPVRHGPPILPGTAAPGFGPAVRVPGSDVTGPVRRKQR